MPDGRNTRSSQDSCRISLREQPYGKPSQSDSPVTPNRHMSPSIQIFIVGGLLLIVVLLAIVAGTLLWPHNGVGASHSNLWKKAQACSLATALIAGFVFWSRPYWYDEADRAIKWAVLGGSNRDISDVLEHTLPNDLEGAIVVLRNSGFVEGWLSVGAVHHHRPLPQPGNTPNFKRNTMRSLNNMLETHNAVS